MSTMLKFSRNKLVSVRKGEQDTLVVHGLLDDDIYGLELDIIFRISNLEIISIDGKWNRWTTPECKRSVQFLPEAVGLCAGKEGFAQEVHKIVGRKACRHYANLLIECGYSAQEAVIAIKYQAARVESPDLTLTEFLNDESQNEQEALSSHVVDRNAQVTEKHSARPNLSLTDIIAKKKSSGMLIDLHVHTSPASPCSSAPVDQIIEQAKRVGLDAICLTDHNYAWEPHRMDNLIRKHGFLVLRGNEITTNQGDVIVFGLDRDITGIIGLDDLRREVLAVGGFMIAAHPIRGFLVLGAEEIGLTPQKAMERPLFKSVDALEVLNGKVTEKENKFASRVALGLGLFATGGSDAHEVSEVGKYATRFFDSIKNEKDLVAALKTGNYSPVALR